MSAWLVLCVAFALLLAATSRAFADDVLFDGFQRPPAEARPFVRWWWNGNCVTETEILRELDLLKEAGIGGIEINPIAMPENSTPTRDEALTWLSPAWNRVVAAAVEGARERGMIADLIVGTGGHRLTIRPYRGRSLFGGNNVFFHGTSLY